MGYRQFFIRKGAYDETVNGVSSLLFRYSNMGEYRPSGGEFRYNRRRPNTVDGLRLRDFSTKIYAASPFESDAADRYSPHTQYSVPETTQLGHDHESERHQLRSPPR